MRILFLGTGEIGLPTLRSLAADPGHELLGVVTQPDKPGGRRMEPIPSPIKLEALARGLPLLQPTRLRRRRVVEELRALAPEVLVVMAYGQILSRAVLDLPTVACLNLHASLLPRHRGAAPIQAALQAGDAESGVTVMYMAEGLDTGDILLEHACRLGRRETGGSLHDRLAAMAPAALAEALSLLARGEAPRRPQEEAQATYAAKLGREDGLLRWEWPAEKLDRTIRAMNPWPGAFTPVPVGSGRKALKVFSSIRYRSASGPPGTILRADRHGLLVAAGEGALLLREVQLEGKRRLPAGEFLRGCPLAPGTLLPGALP